MKPGVIWYLFLFFITSISYINVGSGQAWTFTYCLLFIGSIMFCNKTFFSCPKQHRKIPGQTVKTFCIVVVASRGWHHWSPLTPFKSHSDRNRKFNRTLLSQGGACVDFNLKVPCSCSYSLKRVWLQSFCWFLVQEHHHLLLLLILLFTLLSLLLPALVLWLSDAPSLLQPCGHCGV